MKLIQVLGMTLVAVVASACGDTSSTQRTESSDASAAANLEGMDASLANELAHLEKANSDKLPPYDKIPDTPVTGFCPSGGDDGGQCEANRLTMLKEWPTAWTGDYQSQRNVAYLLSQPSMGVPQNPIQGCAWRMVIIASGHADATSIDTTNYNLDCRKLSEIELETAKASAANIYKKVKGETLPKLPAPEVR